MRRLLACLIVALVVPASAAATSFPPLHRIRSAVRYVPTASQHRASCSENGRSAKAARLTRKLAPVACEQPPRPKLRSATSVVFFGP